MSFIRSQLRTLWIPITLILSFSMSAQAQDDNLRIIYTGKLFGYYRIEPGQKATQRPVLNLLDALKAYELAGAKPEAVILGMGDNFAPEMGAALQLQNESECQYPPDPKLSPPESLYKDDSRIARMAKCDNVANFLIHAHYRAIVPGREDFLYGATWLRKMSNLLKDRNASREVVEDKTGDKVSLSLLAANLRLSFENPVIDLVIPSGYETPPQPCPLFFSQRQNLTLATCANKQTPSTIDWLDRFDKVLQPGSGLLQIIQDQINKDQLTKDKATTGRLLNNERAAMFSMLPPDQDFDSLRIALASMKFDPSKPSENAAGPDALRQEWQDVFKKVAKRQEDALRALKEEGGRLSDQKRAVNKKLWLDHLNAYVDAVITAHKSGKPVIDEIALNEGRKALLYAVAEEQRDVGYSILSTTKGNILVIGVVGQATMSGTQPGNKELCLKVDQQQASNPAAGSSLKVPYLTDAAISFTSNEKCPHQGTVQVFDPVHSIDAILRATSETNEANFFQYRIIMAQMPHTAAEELVSRLQQDARRLPKDSLPLPDIVLSEAQIDHVSPWMKLEYNPHDSIPVLTPSPGYVEGHLVQPESHLLIHSTVDKRIVKNIRRCKQDEGQTIQNLWECEGTLGQEEKETSRTIQSVRVGESEKNTTWAESGLSTLSLLNEILRKKNKTLGCEADVPTDRCKLDAIKLLLELMQRSELSDMAMLPRRDFFLDAMPKGYDEYEDICGENPPNTTKEHCQLQVALDRILWKGDHAERVMVSGRDLQKVLDDASSLSSQEVALVPNDLFQEWVNTFGIVTSPSANLTRLAMSSGAFYVGQEPICQDIAEQKKLAATNATMYCVNGVPIVSDRAYALVTSDSFAEDKAIYKTLTSLPDGYHDKPNKAYLTHILADAISTGKNPGTRQILAAHEAPHQQRRLLTVDIAKVVAGYNASLPSGGDKNVASNFQGASDSRAASPHKAELDLEAKTRIASHGRYVTLGMQADLEYDRSVQGNLAGTPVNGVYQPNSFTTGGFLQFSLGRPPILHTVSLVIAPYQYQRQIVGTYLYFPFTSSPTSQLTVATPAAYGFSNRAGLRWDVRSTGKSYLGDLGSYFEVGAQFGWQNNVISQLTLATAGSPVLSCPASSNTSLGNCVKSAKYPIDATTTAALNFETLHQHGLYWDIHYQRALKKDEQGAPQISLVIDTQGDYFRPRSPGKTLSTQTYYDDLLKIGFAFPVLRNLAFAPTYSPFFYGNQIAQHSLVVNTFSLTARWYFDRDAGVRFKHQLVFVGPASADQTTTSGKTK